VKPYILIGDCASLGDGDAINEMRRQSYPITYRTMLKHCEGLLDWAKDAGYDRYLTLKSDWHVSYHKAKWKGIPCYYLVWSHFEVIWLRQEVTT
jgi:hypothetical protein